MFPVNRIFCVGRSYQAHAAEMGDKIDKTTQEPFYFIKDLNAIKASGSDLPYPPGTEDLHYEMEWVVAIDQPGFEVDEEKAESMIYGYACGLDMTRRDLQQKGKDKRRPWDLGKNFEGGAIISDLVPKAATGILSNGTIELRVNGETKQSADISDLIWSPAELVMHLSKYYHLEPGDLIYTGTPEGVGPVVRGDRIEGSVEGVGSISLNIV
jgi:fumarylpyruvate hydrolase